MAAGSCVVPTNALLRDGVRPSVVAKHLVGQADHTVSLYVTHLVEGETEAGLYIHRWFLIKATKTIK